MTGTHFFSLDDYHTNLLLIGIMILSAAIIPNILNNKNITAPIIYIFMGAILYFLGDNYAPIAIPDNFKVIEQITEFVILIALTNAGLKIKKPFSWATWKYSFRLLSITMPLTIIASAFTTSWILGLAPAAAILFGALISPTDPVLASDLQTTQPSKKDISKTRLALTSEAGINDGLAFPFTFFAIFLVSKGMNYSEWVGQWLLVDFLYKITAGVIAGYFLGYLFYKLVFSIMSKNQQQKISRGILSLSLTLVPYVMTEFIGGYGFIAVFVAASAFSNSEKELHHMDNLHDFTEEIERMFVAFLFIIFGIYVAANFDDLSDFKLLLTAIIIIAVIRPLFGWLALLKTGLSNFEKFVLSFYGIRGVGSIYYLMYALGAAEFPDSQKLIQLTAVTILLSVFIHGISAATIQKKLDKHDAS